MNKKALLLAILFFSFASIVPAAEFGVVLLVGATDVKIEWDQNNSDPDISQFRVYRSDTSGAYDESKLRGEVDASITTYTDVEVPDGTWFWTATAVDTSGNESQLSNEISQTLDTVPPSEPKNLRFAQ